MNIDLFVEENRDELINLYSQIYAGHEIEKQLRDISEEEFQEKCCLDAVIIKLHNQGELDFPIEKIECEFTPQIASVLHSLVMCEQGVVDGLLIKNGSKFSPVKGKDINRDKYGKYIDAVL